MGVSQRLKNRFRKFLQRPGTTVDLAPLRRRLPEITAREDELAVLADEALTEAANAAQDYVEICAIGREAARRALQPVTRPSSINSRITVTPVSTRRFGRRLAGRR